jgi:hypothetical protein
VTSFACIPHDAVPAIREAVRDPLLVEVAGSGSPDAVFTAVLQFGEPTARR